MPTTTTRAKEHQEQWRKIASDPNLRDLPYKVETNSRGQIVLSPPTAYHSHQQKGLEKKLDRLLPGGEAFSEYPIATSAGTKQADVIWASARRQQEMKETGDPPTIAPEISVEVMSDSNTWEEMQEKWALYLEAGAEEVWIVTEEEQVRFFEEEELEHSEIAPEFPDQL